MMVRRRSAISAPPAALVAVLAFLCVSAQAAGGPAKLGSFGPAGPSAGGFRAPAAIAVEQSTGDVYVYNRNFEGKIYKFNAKGEPEDFSSLHTNVIEDVGFGTEFRSEIAVDNSSGPAKGDIYVATGEKVVIFSSTGVELATFTEAGEPCGVTVGSNGDLYVAFHASEAVAKYIPTVNPASEADYASSLWKVGGVCNIAADSAGDIYAAGSEEGAGGVTKYAASQFNTEETPASGTQIDPDGYSLAVDPTNDDVFVDSRSEVEVYTPAGVLAERFGASELGEESEGVAVSAASGHENDVYVADTEENEVAIFGQSSGPGTPGPPGPKGERGETGEPGINGTNGGRGERGPVGEAGPAGAQGEKGVAGVAGTNGSDGTPGAPGPTGARGPAGPAGKVELVNCKRVKGRRRCRTRLVTGTVRFAVAGPSSRATLSRHGAVYATGTARIAHGRISLRLLPLRRLRPGRYTLTLVSGAGRDERIRRELFRLR